MQLTLRALSALLRYPDEDLQQVARDLPDALARDGLLTTAQIDTLAPLIRRLVDEDLLDLQEDYVALFDRGRTVSLLLFEHVHGESRDRGQAMVDLRSRYEAQGLEIAVSELPDYLPLFVEYLSVLDPAQAREELAQPGLIIAALAGRLEEKGTPWAAPMRVLADLAGASGEEVALAPPDDPDDLAELDKAWEEEQVRFEAPAAPDAPQSCPQVETILDRIRNPEHAGSKYDD